MMLIVLPCTQLQSWHPLVMQHLFFGEISKLEPMTSERKARWRKEIEWLLSTGLANVSLKYNSVGFYQMAKIAVTPSIVMAEFVLYSKKVSWPKGSASSSSGGFLVNGFNILEFLLVIIYEQVKYLCRVYQQLPLF
ncbi:unnamed protein product [Lupinus luteus]|uniref:PRONE domain-containing protein n=1 Tax=Lupinus luteus TaxID=3873 RepID=A0AAV1WJS5_LUPLU